ncbi:putative sodium-dependent multivitamin transporter [Episyrphus balteatus]|uniref:putative sodium-dependent multivitamin transporter n=1 Tax=Episyrphus balteatus TaxID=286459 RepID=UPI0024854062|nr:putative sodium-dependent multivitamin transporter [Episyrphus balteatus]
MSLFTIWDYLVLLLVLASSAAIGVYYRLTGGRQKTTKEYLLADGNMPAWPVAFSLMASFMSAITLLGVSMESYQYGMMFAWINLSYVLSTPIAAYLYLPVFYNMQNTSVYEYLERRFGFTTRLIASIAFSVQMILYMGIVLYAPALALEAVTGINKDTAILTLGLVCTFYSTLGGMKAVLVTDVFQSILMFAAIYCVIFCSAFQGDGFKAIWNTAAANGRLNFDVFTPDPTIRHSFWSLTLGGSVTYLSLYAINQGQVQRLMSVKSLKGAQRALWLNIPILCSISFSTLFSGLAIYYYYKGCDPVLQGRTKVRDQLMPLFVVDTMSKYPGLSGLFVSGIFSASLSSVSSTVSSLVAVTLEDYVKPFCEKVLKKPISESSTTLPSKIMVFFYGIICICLAFSAGALGGVLQASLTIFGVVGGPLLGLFTIGIFTTKANQRGALFGLLVGFVISFWIGFGQPKPPIPVLPLTATECSNFNGTSIMTASNLVPDTTEYFYLFRISYLFVAVLGFLITTIVGYVSSIVFEMLKIADNANIYLNEAKTQIDYDLFAPPISNLLKRKALAQMIVTSENEYCLKNTEF